MRILTSARGVMVIADGIGDKREGTPACNQFGAHLGMRRAQLLLFAFDQGLLVLAGVKQACVGTTRRRGQQRLPDIVQKARQIGRFADAQAGLVGKQAA